MLRVSANVQVVELHQKSLPRLGSRVRIPPSAPEKIQLTGLRGADFGPSWRLQGAGVPHLHHIFSHSSVRTGGDPNLLGVVVVGKMAIGTGPVWAEGVGAENPSVQLGDHPVLVDEAAQTIGSL